MHELGIATQISHVVTRVMEEHSAEKAGEIAIEVGLLSCIDPSSLEFCFEAITKGTKLEGARLKIEEVRPMAKCRKCGEEYEVDMADFRCRSCGSPEFDMLTGSEISIRHVEVE